MVKISRNWDRITDEELIQLALVHPRPVDCIKTDSGLYTAISKRQLNQKIWPERQQPKWANATDNELIELAKSYARPSDCKSNNGGLYTVIRLRKLLEAAWPCRRQRRDWSNVPDAELIELGKTHKNVGTCQDLDSGLEFQIRKRKLSQVIWPKA
jgi:hypothetical protein